MEDKITPAANKAGASIFKFRAKIQGLFGPFNSLANQVFKITRLLARLRTIAFLFVSVFAVRQVTRFFGVLLQKTGATRDILQDVQDRLNLVFRHVISKIVPGVQALSDLLFELFEKFLRFIFEQRDWIRATLEWIGQAIEGIKAVSKLFTVALLLFINGINTIRLVWNKFLVNLTDGTTKTFGIVQEGLNVLDDLTRGLITTFGVFFEGADEAKKRARGFFNSIRGAIQGIRNDVPNIKKSIADIESQMRSVGGAVVTLIDGMGEDLKAMFDPELVRKWAQTGVDWITFFTISFIEGLNLAKDSSKVAWDIIVQDMNKAFISIRDKWKTIAGQLITGIYGSLETAIADVILDGLVDRTKKIRDIVADLLRDISRQVLKSAISATLGRAVGGLGASITGAQHGEVIGAQHGETVMGTQVRKVGEVPEAIIPLRGGKVPVRKGGGMGGVSVTFNVNAVDGPSVTQMLTRERRTITTMIREAVKGRDHSLRQVVARA
jgi:hypothetical protein